MNEQIAQYIRENRDRYTRQAINDQLKAAGHDARSIDEAWAVVGAAERPDPELPRVRYRSLVLILVILGGVAAFIAGSSGPYVGPLWAISYVISALIVMGIGIGMTRAASGSGWIAVVVLAGLAWAAALWVTATTVAAGGDPLPGFLATGVAAVVTLTAFAVHRYRQAVPLLAYALPVLGWLAITGVCVSPLLTGT